VLLVRNEIFTLAFLNRLVMKVVSLPMYVKVALLCVETCVCVAAFCSLDASGDGHGVGGRLWLWIGKALFAGCSVWWSFLYCNHHLVGCRCLACYIGIV
jgi:hypothetical protein